MDAKQQKDRWMTILQPCLRNRCLGDVILPGTHNSGSFSITTKNAVMVNKMIPLQLAFKLGLKDFAVDWAINHEGDFQEQLMHGFRVLDLRISYLPEANAFHWWHGVTGSEISQGLRQIKEFVARDEKEIVVLRISHLNCPGSSVSCRRLDIPSEALRKLGDLVHSIFSDNFLPSKMFQASTTFDQIWKTGKNVFVFIEDTLFNRLGHSDVFVYNWADRRVHGAKFPFLTNPRKVLQYREVVLSTQRRKLNDVMTYNPFIVTHQTINMIGALLQTKLVLFSLSGISLVCCLGYDYCLNKPSTIQGAMLSLLVCHLAIWLTGHCLGFEGQASSLIEMSRIANTYGMGTLGFPFNKWYPTSQIYNRGFNTVVRMWSQQPNKYKMNMILVDDFYSSEAVDIAIDFVKMFENDKK